MIPSALSKQFTASARSRGDEYVSQRRVRMVRATANRLLALVRGTADYTVDILARAGELEFGCTCPYAAEYGTCKHLWAVLRQCDADGALPVLLRTAGAQPLLKFTGDEYPEDIDGMYMDDGEEDDDPEYDDAMWFPELEDLKHARVSQTPARGAPPKPAAPDWMRVIDSAHRQMQFQMQHQPSHTTPSTRVVWPANKRLVYILDVDASMHADGIVIDLGTESLARDGTWGEAKRFGLGVPVWFAHPNPTDQQIAEMLCGSGEPSLHGRVRTSGFLLRTRSFSTTVRMIIESGRCRLRSSRPGLTGRTLHFDGNEPWKFRLRVRRDDSGGAELAGILARGDQEMSLTEPLIISASGFLIAGDTLARFDHDGAFPLVYELRQQPEALPVTEDIADMLARIYALPRVPQIDLPSELTVTEIRENPVPTLTISTQENVWRGTQTFYLTCAFQYGALRIAQSSPVPSHFDKSSRVLHHRQPAFEQESIARLAALGAREEWSYQAHQKLLTIARTKMMPLMLTLIREGWQVQAEGVSYHTPGAIVASVSSGIDWFDLSGHVRYGDTDVPIASILDARRRGDDFVQVADGRLGLMPTHWLEKLGPLIAAGESVNGSTRYRRSQLSILDALLASMPEVDIDEKFARARTELRNFKNLAAVSPSTTFRGTLREYQREGLGWLHFLRKFELGGCLADDMGLGKTVQVLALLEARRLDGHGPSLVVVPRSLVFNWLREAERFAPELRMLDFSGAERRLDSIAATNVDVVITTYGTLRRDAPMLADVEFDYAILDEAQAIKNATTATAKASRLLRARHRLVMSGTPIENRIEELWSLLEFLNPGMLGTSSKFSALVRKSDTIAQTKSDGSPAVIANGNSVIDASNPTPITGHALLARALRPIILRRTKEHVASELPARVEQTLEVDLEPKQRKFYESIRSRVQREVMDRVARLGIQKSQLHILEALLRLRQAACHPVLVDGSKAALPSAKLDALIPALESIKAEGHKSLVFSQFTAFLALVRARLEASGIPYEYLDGKTRDRQARVDRFQSDAACPVFLISLKAGGHGLNLTAADYVYLLDPWWNPAVEAQAIDRAHRIGQTRRVIATRLVARDTIEAKILQLQSTKRALADAVLSAEKGGLASIGKAELELLLGA